MNNFTNRVLMLLIIFLSACTAPAYKIGQKFNTNSIHEIIVGQTTQGKILGLLGEPLRVGLSNGNEIYIYSYEEIFFESKFFEPEVVKRNGNTLVIEFDKNKVVKNFYYNVPGKEPMIIGLLIHKRQKEKREEEDITTTSDCQPF